MILIGCVDGLTAAQAARIGFGICLGTVGAVMTLAAAALAWDAWKTANRGRASGTSARNRDFEKETEAK